MMNHPGTTRRLSWPRLILGLALLLGLGTLVGGRARPVYAQTTLTVTNCYSDTQLQADVAQANHDNADDIITFACNGDIKLSSTLTITGNMTLSGSGHHVTLDGGGSVEVIYVSDGSASVNLTLNALTIAHGTDANPPPFAIGFSGGLADEASGTVSISNSTFAYNTTTTGSGAGLWNSNSGTVSISNSTFANNNGTGLWNNGGTVDMSNSTFANNTTTIGDGGGFENFQGTANISNSTFAYNTTTTGSGGGLFNEQGTLNISNSTFANNSSSNSAQGSSGGGLANLEGTVSISNSTFAYNSAQASSGGGLFNGEGTLTISGSIVADNTGDDCLNADSLSILVDNGYNLSSDSSCGFTGTGSLQNTNPNLVPLASNGGPTQTLALLKGSPASDVIPGSLCPATDQRGHKRPDNPKESTCDIGAFES